MPKKNLDLAMKDLNGETIYSEEGRARPMKSIVTEALLASFPNETASGEEKLKRYLLAMKVNVGGEVDLSPEEIVMIKDLVGKGFSPLVVGQVFGLLNE